MSRTDKHGRSFKQKIVIDFVVKTNLNKTAYRRPYLFWLVWIVTPIPKHKEINRNWNIPFFKGGGSQKHYMTVTNITTVTTVTNVTTITTVTAVTIVTTTNTVTTVTAVINFTTVTTVTIATIFDHFTTATTVSSHYCHYCHYCH